DNVYVCTRLDTRKVAGSMSPTTVTATPCLWTAAETTVGAVLAQLPQDRAARQATYIVWPAASGYIAVRWSELEVLASRSPIALNTPIGRVKGLPSEPNAYIVNAADADVRAPVILTVGGTIWGVLADTSAHAEPPSVDPFAGAQAGGSFSGVLSIEDEPEQ